MSLAFISTLLLAITFAPPETWASIVSAILFSEIAPVTATELDPATPAVKVEMVPDAVAEISTTLFSEFTEPPEM